MQNLHKFKTDITNNGNTTTQRPQQNCGSASAESKPDCIMPSASNFAEGKTEYPPMHSGEFDISPTNSHTIVHIIDAL